MIYINILFEVLRVELELRSGGHFRPFAFSRPFRHPFAVGFVAAAADRFRRFRRARQHQWPASAGRSGQPLAHHGRQLDPATRRGPDRRYLLLHIHRPALDRQGMGFAGADGAGVQRRRLGRRGGAVRGGFRRHLGGPAAPASPGHPAAAGAAVHRGGLHHDGLPFPGTAVRARLPLHAVVGRRLDPRCRGAPRARAIAARGDAGLGQPARRTHPRPDAGRCLRDRGSDRRPILSSAR